MMLAELLVGLLWIGGGVAVFVSIIGWALRATTRAMEES